MEKQTKNILIGIVAIAIAVLLFGGQLGLFSSVNGKEITRSVPNTVSPGQTFTVTYIPTGVSGITYGVSITDSITGGCKFSDGTTSLKYVLLSPATSQSFTMTAPTSGTCLFTGGDFKYGTDAIGQIPDAVITVVLANTTICSAGQTKCEGTTSYTCSNSDWKSQGQVNGLCGYTSITSCTDTCSSLGYTSGNYTICGVVTNCGSSSVPTFQLGMVLFQIGNFQVTLLYLLIAVGSLFIIKLVFSK